VRATMIPFLRTQLDAGHSESELMWGYRVTAADIAAARALPELFAEELGDGWTVVDPEGGRWWPDAATAADIAGSDDPATTAVASCRMYPARGTWVA
jgi:hypothetical protein